jgi:prepilin-type N-terminal cleavage/methylation domain-containing protein
MSRSFSRSSRGVTLIECVVAMTVVGLGLGALMAVNSHQLQLVRSSQMRIAHWKQLVDPNFLRAKFYAMAPKAGGGLGNLREKITVTSYPDAGAAQPLIVEREFEQTPVIRAAGAGLADQESVRVDVELTYTGMGGRERNRQVSLVVSNGGINRLTLPAFGAAASGTAATEPGGSGTSGTGDGRGNIGGESGVK